MDGEDFWVTNGDQFHAGDVVQLPNGEPMEVRVIAGTSWSQTWDTDKMESRVIETKYDAKTGETVVVRDDVYKLVRRENPKCDVYWGSHGCDLDRGHDGACECECCECADHERDHEAEGCVAKPPYYGADTTFFGDDAERLGLPKYDPAQ